MVNVVMFYDNKSQSGTQVIQNIVQWKINKKGGALLLKCVHLQSCLSNINSEQPRKQKSITIGTPLKNIYWFQERLVVFMMRCLNWLSDNFNWNRRGIVIVMWPLCFKRLLNSFISSRIINRMEKRWSDC